MEAKGEQGKVKRQIAGQPVSSYSDPIDPHRRDRHARAPDRPDDESLRGAKRHGDSIPGDGDTVDPSSRPQPAEAR